MEDKKILSVKDIMEYTGFGEKRVRELLKSKESTFTINNGNRLYAHKDLLDKYLIEKAKNNTGVIDKSEVKAEKTNRYDRDGRLLPKGISQRKDGRYEYRKTHHGKKFAYYSFNYNEIIAIKNECESLLNNEELDKTLAFMYEEMIEMKNLNDGKYIYFISNGTHCKIGYASDVNRRLSDLQCGNTEKLELLYSFKTIDYKNMETQLHKLFSKYHVFGEWYDILFLFD